ncbi:unnamed protein product [Ectocarpus sp. 13 AM-2016]
MSPAACAEAVAVASSLCFIRLRATSSPLLMTEVTELVFAASAFAWMSISASAIRFQPRIAACFPALCLRVACFNRSRRAVAATARTRFADARARLAFLQLDESFINFAKLAQAFASAARSARVGFL